MSVNLIHDDLVLYKQAYENALNKIRDLNNTIKKYDKKIAMLKSELYKEQNSEEHHKKKKSYSSSNSDELNSNSKNNNINISSNQKYSYLIKYVKLSYSDLYEIKTDILNKINQYIINITDNLLKLKNENKKLINNNKSLINENLAYIKDYIKLKKNNNNFTYRENTKNTIESNLVTDISYKGNYDKNENKNKNNNLKKIKNNNLINNSKNINIKNNYYLDTIDKINQSAENIKNNSEIFFEEERKKNLTEINFDEFEEVYQKYYNKFGKDS
jgi:hypothetical protein